LGYNCKTLDYLDADSLRKKYASNSRIDISKVEEVDYVWQGEPLDQLISEHNCFDYIIASHVIEHLPDLLGFLQQCEVLLKEGGILSLVVPDKRYCFDCFRWPSTTGDVLQAAIEKRTLHTPGVVFDFFSSYCVRDKQLAWFKGCTKQFELFHSFETAIAKMEKSLMQSDYIDVHNWRFTPSSFKLVLADLFTMEKIQLKEVSFYDTVGSEFYVSLQLDKSSNTKMTFDRLCLLKKTMLETLESLNELSN
jgi:predicted SAM-dependent methyltransferase